MYVCDMIVRMVLCVLFRAVDGYDALLLIVYPAIRLRLTATSLSPAVSVSTATPTSPPAPSSSTCAPLVPASAATVPSSRPKHPAAPAAVGFRIARVELAPRRALCNRPRGVTVQPRSIAEQPRSLDELVRNVFELRKPESDVFAVLVVVRSLLDRVELA